MNVVSFCIYGNEPRYLEGLYRNLRDLPQFYRGWTAFVFADVHVNSVFLKSVRASGATTIVRDMGQDGVPDPMFWRFEVADWPGVERFVVRDADSRFSYREQAAVRDWVRSGIIGHVMRDHPHHNQPIMGGLWGGLRDLVKHGPHGERAWHHIRQASRRFFAGARTTAYGTDQRFLQEWVLPRMEAAGMLRHDTFNPSPGSLPFPEHQTPDRVAFVGEVFDEHDVPRAEDRLAREAALQY